MWVVGNQTRCIQKYVAWHVITYYVGCSPKVTGENGDTLLTRLRIRKIRKAVFYEREKNNAWKGCFPCMYALWYCGEKKGGW